MYYDPRILMGGWFSDYCLYCGNLNHIMVDIPDAQAWECWYCSSHYWIDDLGREMYCMEEGIDEDVANANLNHPLSNIKFLNGRFEQSE